jgi:hypothetical protein
MSAMTTRLGPEQQSRDWPYPTDLAGFLQAVRADPADDYDTRTRIEMFMLTPVAMRMPGELQKALVEAGLYPPADMRRVNRRLRP